MECEYIIDDRTCFDRLNCCDCGHGECGCRYCWSCNACDNCKEE